MKVKEKFNTDGAIVKGLNIELKYSPNKQFIFQLATTIQSAKYNSLQQDLEENIDTEDLLRTPNVYGNLLATYKPRSNWDINLVTVYTGSMKVVHLAGYIAENRLETTKGLVDINQYQNDFDKGALRDSNYIYGPALPRTVFVGLKVKM